MWSARKMLNLAHSTLPQVAQAFIFHHLVPEVFRLFHIKVTLPPHLPPNMVSVPCVPESPFETLPGPSASLLPFWLDLRSEVADKRMHTSYTSPRWSWVLPALTLDKVRAGRTDTAHLKSWFCCHSLMTGHQVLQAVVARNTPQRSSTQSLRSLEAQSKSKTTVDGKAG